MKRYHEEKALCEHRAKLRRHLDLQFGVNAAYAPEKGRFRKALRRGGCGRARCQVCHPEKFPKRELTRQEKKARLTDREDET